MSAAPRSTAAASGDPRTGSRGGVPWRRVRTAVLGLVTVLVLLGVASVTGLLPLRAMRVESGSMAPTVSAGDLLLVRAGGAAVQRGDVVVAAAPDDGGLLVKRAVGVGGDEVAVEDGVLVVNGAPACEPVIDPAAIDGVWFGPVTVPPDAVFLLSDERDRAVDSRSFGPVPVADLVGRVDGRLWPDPGRLPTLGC